MTKGGRFVRGNSLYTCILGFMNHQGKDKNVQDPKKKKKKI